MDGKSTITALLKAESEAKQVVEQARQERKAQLRRAQLEANDEIITLKEAATNEVRLNPFHSTPFNFILDKKKHFRHFNAVFGADFRHLTFLGKKFTFSANVNFLTINAIKITIQSFFNKELLNQNKKFSIVDSNIFGGSSFFK